MQSGAKPLIGLTGSVYSDGLGDFEHILNAGLTLSKKMGQEYDFIYQIEISDQIDEKFNLQRIIFIRDKLIKNKIINPDGDYSGITSKEIMQKINDQNNHVHLFGTSNIAKFQDKFKEQNVKLWVVASEPPFKGEPLFAQKAMIYLLEHGEYNAFIPLYMDYKIPIEDFFTMGIGRVKGIYYKTPMDEKPKDGKQQGLFLTQIDHAQHLKEAALSKIQNPDFNQLLWGRANPPSPPIASRILENTTIIPTYIQNSGVGMCFLTAACMSPLAQKYDNVLIPCKLTEAEIKNPDLLGKLKKAGYTEVEIAKKEAGKLVIESINLDYSDSPRKVKFLTQTFFDEADFDNVRLAANDMMLFSGDNTFQNTISYGLLPIIEFPDRKIKVIRDLIAFLGEHPKGGDWFEIIQLLRKFVELSDLKGEKFSIEKQSWGTMLAREETNIQMDPTLLYPHLERLAQLMTPKALEQWQEISQELVLNHNAHDSIVKLVNDKLNRLYKAQPQPLLQRQPSGRQFSWTPQNKSEMGSENVDPQSPDHKGQTPKKGKPQ